MLCVDHDRVCCSRDACSILRHFIVQLTAYHQPINIFNQHPKQKYMCVCVRHEPEVKTKSLSEVNNNSLNGTSRHCLLNSFTFFKFFHSSYAMIILSLTVSTALCSENSGLFFISLFHGVTLLTLKLTLLWKISSG